jgi:hypothetical protein
MPDPDLAMGPRCVVARAIKELEAVVRPVGAPVWVVARIGNPWGGGGVPMREEAPERAGC